MTITTVEQAILGVKPVEYFHNSQSGGLSSGRPFCPIFTGGIPGPAVAPTPGLSGAVLTSLSGGLPFPATVSGETIHLANFIGTSTGATGTLMLVDFLWWNSDIDITSTSAQTINSVTFPPRDKNGATDGAGVQIGLIVSTGTGSGTPTITLDYTNQSGVTGRTATNLQNILSFSILGTFYQFGLQAGDTGVRSIQAYQQSATCTSGTVHLVAYRVIATLDILSIYQPEQLNMLTGGLPRLYNGSCLTPLFIPSSSISSILYGSCTFTQG